MRYVSDSLNEQTKVSRLIILIKFQNKKLFVIFSIFQDIVKKQVLISNTLL